MNVRYWIPPDTATLITRCGGPFERFTTDKALVFEQTVAESDDEFTFAAHGWQLRVAKALVWRHQWGAYEGQDRPGSK